MNKEDITASIDEVVDALALEATGEKLIVMTPKRREQLKQQIEDFREVLKWYADKSKYYESDDVFGPALIDDDMGKKARDILTKYSQEGGDD